MSNLNRSKTSKICINNFIIETFQTSNTIIREDKITDW